MPGDPGRRRMFTKQNVTLRAGMRRMRKEENFAAA
jgi:hypothetical protein